MGKELELLLAQDLLDRSKVQFKKMQYALAYAAAEKSKEIFSSHSRKISASMAKIVSEEALKEWQQCQED